MSAGIEKPCLRLPAQLTRASHLAAKQERLAQRCGDECKLQHGLLPTSTQAMQNLCRESVEVFKKKEFQLFKIKQENTHCPTFSWAF